MSPIKLINLENPKKSVSPVSKPNPLNICKLMESQQPLVVFSALLSPIHQFEFSPCKNGISVCSSKKKIYVGRNQTIIRIEKGLELGGPVVEGFDEEICHISECCSTFYTLTKKEDTFIVYTHDCNGKPDRRWAVVNGDTTESSMNFVVIDYQLVVPDRPNKMLVVLPTKGGVRKIISCPFLSKGFISIAAVDETSVVINDALSGRLYRLDIHSNVVMWIHHSTDQLLGIHCYKGKYLFAYSKKDGAIKVFDIATGL